MSLGSNVKARREALNMTQARYIDEQTESKLHSFLVGQQIEHDELGKGIIVGFSRLSGEPVAYFYDDEIQRRYGFQLICISSKNLKFTS